MRTRAVPLWSVIWALDREKLQPAVSDAQCSVLRGFVQSAVTIVDNKPCLRSKQSMEYRRSRKNEKEINHGDYHYDYVREFDGNREFEQVEEEEYSR